MATGSAYRFNQEMSMADELAKPGDMVRSKKFPDRCAMVQRVESTANGPVYSTAIGWWLANEVKVEPRIDTQRR